MDIAEIVSAWEAKKLPDDIDTLATWKEITDRAEEAAFNAWRTETCKTAGGQLVDDHLLYHAISIGLHWKIGELRYAAIRKQKKSDLF